MCSLEYTVVLCNFTLPAMGGVAHTVSICWRLQQEEGYAEREKGCRCPRSYLVGMTIQGGVWSVIHWSEALLVTSTNLVSKLLVEESNTIATQNG